MEYGITIIEHEYEKIIASGVCGTPSRHQVPCGFREIYITKQRSRNEKNKQEDRSHREEVFACRLKIGMTLNTDSAKYGHVLSVVLARGR
jgi:hypothetical protein